MPAPRDTRVAEAPGWFWKHGLWMVGLGFLFSALLATFVDMDPRLSGYFYDPTAAQQWFLKTAVPGSGCTNMANGLPWYWPLGLRWCGAGVSAAAHGYVIGVPAP